MLDSGQARAEAGHESIVETDDGVSSGTDSPMEVIVRIAPSACRSDPVTPVTPALDQADPYGLRLVCVEGLSPVIEGVVTSQLL